MECYSAFKRKEILMHTITWDINLDLILNKMSVTKQEILYDS